MSYKISIEGGESFAVSSEEDTLLRGALRAGIGLPHECSVGGCGACRFELTAGEMETLWPDAPGLSDRDRKRGKRLACQSRPLGDCSIKARCAEEYRPVVATRRQTVRLVERRLVARDMLELTFQAPVAAEFRPGQYALLYPPGAEGARAYSMSNLANEAGLWQFIVRRVPGGRGSNALFDRVHIGDELVLDGPYGHAYLRDDNEREVVCIAGGSGLAPMLSIARQVLGQADALGRPAPRRVRFFDGARTIADLCGEALLADMPQALLSYLPVLSEPSDSWSGAVGFVHQAVAKTLPQPFAQYDFYFAGPPPMIEAIQTLLMIEHKVPFQQIHFDRFV